MRCCTPQPTSGNQIAGIKNTCQPSTTFESSTEDLQDTEANGHMASVKKSSRLFSSKISKLLQQTFYLASTTGFLIETPPRCSKTMKINIRLNFDGPTLTVYSVLTRLCNNAKQEKCVKQRKFLKLTGSADTSPVHASEQKRTLIMAGDAAPFLDYQGLVCVLLEANVFFEWKNSHFFV